MRQVSLPGWVFVLSLALFVTSWLLAAPLEPLPQAPGSLVQRTPWRQPLLSPPRTPAHATPSAPDRPRVVFGGGTFEVALTFDDGPHPVHTASLLRILARHQVKAAFFVNGCWLDRGRAQQAARQVLQEAHRQGHAVGNHTYGHRMLAELTPDEQTWQIVANETLISSIVGERPTLFRPPYGHTTHHSAALLASRGYVEAGWNAATAEETLDAESISRELLRWLRHHRGGIVLLHDRLPRSVAAVDLLLTELARINCRRLASNQPTFRLVSLQSMLGSPTESWDRARAAAAERARHESLLRACEDKIIVAQRSRSGYHPPAR